MYQLLDVDSWSLIDEDLRLIPEFTIENVLQYFIYRKERDGLERQDWKNFKSGGYNLYKEGHVQKVYASISTNVVDVKGICLPEMKKDRTYPLVLTLDKMTADVTNAKCSCPAGQGPSGSCKHLAALCYALEDYVKLRAIIMEAGENSCTSLLQKWNQPRKRRLDSKKVEDIDFSSLPHGKDAPTRIHYKSYDPRPPSMRKTTKTELEELTQQLSTLTMSCGFLHLLSQPSEAESAKGIYSLPLTPRSIQARVRHKLFQGVLPPTWQIIQECGKEFTAGITPSDAEKAAIEEKTRLQSRSVRWHEERLNRLTASNFGRVIVRKSGFDKLAKDIVFVTVPPGVPSIKWGRDHEAEAFKEYENQVKQRHPNLKLRKAGIYIGNPPYLGASPDGILEENHLE